MKKIITLALILLIASCKKDQINLSLVREFSIESISNGAKYTIKVALPEDYNPSKKLATIYILDGEENFDYVAENCKKISSEYSTSNVLVVSIGYGNDRSFDYTPTKVNNGGGGAENFMRFLQNELIPKMESDFGSDTSRSKRIIIGHSFGGLLAAYAFTNFNNVFGNYIMLSPSIWYDNEILLHYEKESRDLNKSNSQLVYMGLGELENQGRMLAPFIAFYQQLKNNYSSIQIEYRLQPHLDHVGSKNPNIIAGLKYYFQNN